MLPREYWLDLIGKPWQYRARGPKSYDCYGLVIEIMKRRGIAIGDIEFYINKLDEHSGSLTGNFPHHWKPLLKQEPGCVIAFGRNNIVTHCGIAIDHNRFIHSSGDLGSIVLAKMNDVTIPYVSSVTGFYEYAI